MSSQVLNFLGQRLFLAISLWPFLYYLLTDFHYRQSVPLAAFDKLTTFKVLNTDHYVIFARYCYNFR